MTFEQLQESLSLTKEVNMFNKLQWRDRPVEFGGGKVFTSLPMAGKCLLLVALVDYTETAVHLSRLLYSDRTANFTKMF